MFWHKTFFCHRGSNPGDSDYEKVFEVCSVLDDSVSKPTHGNTCLECCHACAVFFCYVLNTTAYHLDKYELASPSTKELHSSNIG